MQRVSFGVLSLCLTFTLACLGGGSDGDTSSGESEWSDSGDDGEGGSGPIFLDFSVNASVATDVDTIRFTAVLTDPDGIEDLIGGTLKNESGASYGSFQTSSAEGSYEIEIRWDDIDTIEPIWLQDSDERHFVAEFFDAGGNRVTRTAELELACDYEPATTCASGRCTDLDTMDNCGACGNACYLGQSRWAAPSSLAWDAVSISGRGGYIQAWCDDSCGVELYAADRDGFTCDEVCAEWECVGALADLESVSCSQRATSLYCSCSQLLDENSDGSGFSEGE